ncbi:MAG: RsbRD N-terminal domain-containing protein [Bryobacteraceae bacterium]
MNDDVVPYDRDAVARHWLARTLGAYPFLTSRFLAEEKDRFRNPVGHALREALPVLLEELLGEMNLARLTPVLDQVVKIRAVQDFTASQAVGFIFVLKDVLRHEEPGGLTPALEQRIDQMALTAFDLYVRCREKMDEIKAGEARRGTYVLDRIGYPRSDGEAR